MKTDTDIRKDLYSNIVLLGWNYMFTGIGKYMTRDKKSLQRKPRSLRTPSSRLPRKP